MKWNNETRHISELKPYEHNPRTLSKEAAKRLEKSIVNTGYAEVIAIDTDNTIIAGHQRYYILMGLTKEQTIDVRVPERKLTDKEFKDYLIASNKDVGDWDYDVLSSLFDADELIGKGFSAEELGVDAQAIIEEAEPESSTIKLLVPKEEMADFRITLELFLTGHPNVSIS